MYFDHDLSIFFRQHLGSASAHLPTQQDTYPGVPNQIFPPGIHHSQQEGISLLHIAHRRRKFLSTSTPSKREKQEAIASHPMPRGTQDGRHYGVDQDSGRPGRPGMADTRMGFVHRFALIL